jgi:hypothetical protein
MAGLTDDQATLVYIVLVVCLALPLLLMRRKR